MLAASSLRFHALLPCAGSGSRAGLKMPKQYEMIAGHPMVHHTLHAFLQVEEISSILIVLAPGDTHPWPKRLPDRVALTRVGGSTRTHSVFNGLTYLLAHGAQQLDWVLVHDAARCLITPALIRSLMKACWQDPVGGLLALPCHDTIKSLWPTQVGQTKIRSVRTVPRDGIWLAQTPQMFRLGALLAALQRLSSQGFQGITDEASAIEVTGSRPLLVRGSSLNFKVTWPEDVLLAQVVLQSGIHLDPEQQG